MKMKKCTRFDVLDSAKNQNAAQESFRNRTETLESGEKETKRYG